MTCPGAPWILQTFDDESYCYAVITYTYDDSQLTYDKPASDCAALPGGNGKLASIHSIDENEYILSGLSCAKPSLYRTVIGIVVSDSTFVWDDGTSLSYTNWAPAQPGNKYPYYMTVMLEDGSWKTIDGMDAKYNTAIACKMAPTTLSV
uniref:C-type lectin domain-containing protein n=1 Tax=Panagrellus redivivus TaxID=6233 RepID=A0A7E4W097_PANRE